MDDDDDGTIHDLPSAWLTNGPRSATAAYFDLLRGEAENTMGTVTLSPSELRLLTYLALTPNGRNLGRLTDDLWPHLDAIGCRNLLKVLVHRIRQKVGQRDCVLSARGMYRFGPMAVPNVERIENSVLKLIRSSGPVDPEMLEAVRSLRRGLRFGRPEPLTSASWFEDTERRLVALQFDVTLVLGRHALAYGECGHVLALTRELIEIDPFDESARALRLAALERCLNRARARAEYESYERLIREELGSTPSPHLRALAYDGLPAT